MKRNSNVDRANRDAYFRSTMSTHEPTLEQRVAQNALRRADVEHTKTLATVAIRAADLVEELNEGEEPSELSDEAVRLVNSLKSDISSWRAASSELHHAIEELAEANKRAKAL